MWSVSSYSSSSVRPMSLILGTLNMQQTNYEGQSKRSWNYLTLTVCCTTNSCHLDTVSLAAATCKYRTGCAMQFRERAATGGRDSGFCITITHRATHRLLCHHSTTVLFGSRCEWLLAVPYSEMDLKGTRFAIMEHIKSNSTAEIRKITKEPLRRCFQQ
jgi:hypothetical protein